MNNIDSELDGDLGHSSLPNAKEVNTEAALLGNANPNPCGRGWVDWEFLGNQQWN